MYSTISSPNLLDELSLTQIPSFQDELDDYAARITTGLEQGWLKPVIGKEYPLSKASEAHTEIIQSSAKGKMVMNVL